MTLNGYKSKILNTQQKVIESVHFCIFHSENAQKLIHLN